MTNNTYFDEMTRVGTELARKREEHKELKQNIINTYGWDSEELKTWYAEEEQMKCAYSGGAWKAYWAWRYTNGNELIFDEFCWDDEVYDFIDTLRKAGIGTFVTIDTSTALMKNLHQFVAEGCEMLGLCTITKKEDCFEKQVLGIRFNVKGGK